MPYYCLSQDKSMIFQKCVKKFVTIPRNILLDEDKLQETQYSEEEFQYMDQHLKDLQSRAKKVYMTKLHDL